MSNNRFPQGWNEERVRRVLEYYDGQSDEEALAEDEDRLDAAKRTVMDVPPDLVPTIRKLIVDHEAV